MIEASDNPLLGEPLWRFCFKFALAKLKPLHGLLPDRVLYDLPLSWTGNMLGTYLASGGTEFYTDVDCPLVDPPSFAPRATVPPEHALGEGEIRSFYEKGYLGPFTAFDQKEMLELGRQLLFLYLKPSEIYPRGSYTCEESPSDRAGEVTRPQVGEAVLRGRDKHLQSPLLLNLFSHPAVVDRLAQLIGPDVMLWRSQYFPVRPRGGGTGWHQASSYLGETGRVGTVHTPDITELFQVTVWFALTDTDAKTACLRILPGTHRMIRPTRATLFDPTKATAAKGGRFGNYMMNPDVDDRTAHNFEMKAGQFVLFTERCFHGSTANESDSKMRLGVGCRIISPKTRVYNPWQLSGRGLDLGYAAAYGISLDRWRAVLLRGTERGANGERVVLLDELRRELATAS